MTTIERYMRIEDYEELENKPPYISINNEAGMILLSVEEVPDPIEPTPEDKLQAAGLTIDDLKKLLGL